MTTDRPDLPPWLSGDPWERELRELLERMDRSVEAVIVEGTNDRKALQNGGVASRIHTCSQTSGLDAFATCLSARSIAILTDYDDPGRRLNAKLREYIPDRHVEPRWRRDLGLLLTKRGRYDIESLNNVFESTLRRW